MQGMSLGDLVEMLWLLGSDFCEVKSWTVRIKTKDIGTYFTVMHNEELTSISKNSNGMKFEDMKHPTAKDMADWIKENNHDTRNWPDD